MTLLGLTMAPTRAQTPKPEFLAAPGEFTAEPVQPLPDLEWDIDAIRTMWWDQFKLYVQNACDYDVPSLLHLHSRRKEVIAAARDLADDMISEYEDRWRE